MNIVTDTDILFDSIKTRNPDNILTRLKNAEHDIFIPLTVLGEVMLIGLSKPTRKTEAIAVMDYCDGIDPIMLTPNLKLRKCCKCIDETDMRIHGLTDRTNLGYATAYNTQELIIAYYVTTDEELPYLRLRCKETCDLNPPRIIPPQTLRRTLLNK